MGSRSEVSDVPVRVRTLGHRPLTMIENIVQT